MLGPRGRAWLPALPVVVCAFVGSPASALAGVDLRLELGGGYGAFTGNELVVTEQSGGGDLPLYGNGCCPSGLGTVGFRLGVDLFEVAAPEFIFLGGYFNQDGEDGGSGIIGGGVRIYPLGILDLAGLVDLGDFPLSVSLGAGAGYILTGSDFAYEGHAFGFDLTLGYRLASFFSIGAKVDLWLPNYDAFALTSYSGNRGRCLDGGGQQILTGGPNGDGIVSGDDTGIECPGNGRGPSTTFISPQLFMAFHFELI